MKTKIFVLALAIVSLGLSSCSKKNEPEQKTYTYDLFDEPCTAWGSSLNTVKNWMSNHNYNCFNEETIDGFRCVYYYGKKQEQFVVNLFLESAGIYDAAYIYLQSGRVYETEVLGHLRERYNYISTTDDILLFRTKDGKTDVELATQIFGGNLYFVVVYSAKS